MQLLILIITKIGNLKKKINNYTVIKNKTELPIKFMYGYFC